MADLRVDLDAVRELGSSLTVVADEFEGANANSDRIAGAVGHEGLAGVVRDFAHKWDDTRGKMTENLRKLAEASTQVAQAFTEVDSELGKALEGQE
ncbi:MAG TPA: type VII secretion target [Promicromonospora sp.]|nr:type VII secretion target [Promicromonospora sp.]